MSSDILSDSMTLVDIDKPKGKKHLVNLFFDCGEKTYSYAGYVDEVIIDGKAICYPIAIFKEQFGFDMPIGTTISMG